MKTPRVPFPQVVDKDPSSINHFPQKSKLASAVIIAGAVLALSACGGEKNEAVVAVEPTAAVVVDNTHAAEPEEVFPESRFGGRQLTMPMDILVGNPSANANRNAYFGDLHVHTTYSFDAFAFGTLATPYDAYRYAKGEAIKHPGGFDVQLREPLDFYAVTDHAMFLGAVRDAADTTSDFSKYAHVEALHNLNAPENMNTKSLVARGNAFATFLPDTLRGIADGTVDVEMTNTIAREAWADTIIAAEEFNKPGEFTTFVAYEYTTSSDDRGNLHRNVIFRGADKLPAMPFSRFHSQNPEGLWDWMDGLREQGIETLAIPHNSNGSNGQMFKLVDWAGNPMDDNYADQRIRNEPLIEITQIKGTSETHPVLSDSDEWADFEIMPYRVATTLKSEPKGSYVREALLNGLAFEDKGVSNPYKFGFIGSSDTHTGATSDDETNYFSKVGLVDGSSDRRGSTPLTPMDAEIIREAGRSELTEIDGKTYATGAYETWGASGLAAVWAEENTREAIYDAFRRKETFATSGPRIRVRLFGGYSFDQAMLDDNDMVTRAYAEGVAMGSDLLAKGDTAPGFIAWAVRDANSAALQRLQIVKGWTVNGEHQEKVYDVACSDGVRLDPETHRCADNGAKVNISDCSISQGLGAAELKTVWTDPEFDASHRAFYYVRALENPTCRWSTWDAIRAGVAPRPDLKTTLQERAWTSPIWFNPES
ncbi:MAG: DUF3604 domain-containing protein [Oceanicoccus sp.]